MHLAADIVLALLFAPQTPAFAALSDRQFCPSGCCISALHGLLPGY
jgi:hypothetical protein